MNKQRKKLLDEYLVDLNRPRQGRHDGQGRARGARAPRASSTSTLTCPCCASPPLTTAAVRSTTWSITRSTVQARQPLLRPPDVVQGKEAHRWTCPSSRRSCATSSSAEGHRIQGRDDAACAGCAAHRAEKATTSPRPVEDLGDAPQAPLAGGRTSSAPCSCRCSRVQQHAPRPAPTFSRTVRAVPRLQILGIHHAGRHHAAGRDKLEANDAIFTKMCRPGLAAPLPPSRTRPVTSVPTEERGARDFFGNAYKTMSETAFEDLRPHPRATEALPQPWRARLR